MAPDVARQSLTPERLASYPSCPPLARRGATISRRAQAGFETRAPWFALRCAACLAAIAAAPASRAADFHVQSTTLAQGYEYGAANGDIVARRRIAQLVQISGYNLLPDNQLFFVSSFRLDADFGLGAAEAAIPGASFLRQDIRELQTSALSLLFGYLAGRNLWGRIDFDAGRQFVVDLVDFFHFDGVRVAVGTPWRFGVEVYAGYEVRAGAPLGSSAFDLPGVAEASDRAPTFGAALYLKDTHFGPYSVSGRLSYRKTQATRALDACSATPTDRDRAECDRLRVSSLGDDPAEVRAAFGRDLVIEERLALSLQARLKNYRVWGGFSYNLINAWMDDVLGGASGRFVGDKLLVELEYLRTRPRFDADSIFNVFGTNAFDDARARVSWTFSGGHEAYGRGYVRFVRSNETGGSRSLSPDILVEAKGGVAGARIAHGPRNFTTAELLVQAGYGGYLFGGDVWSRFFLLENRLSLDGRLLVLRFDDDRLENLHGVNLTLQAGARWQIHKHLAAHLIVEESINRLYTSIFRVYGMLEVGAWL
jgi:hypothetical protein